MKRNNCMHQYRLGNNLMEMSSEKKDFAVLMDKRLAVSKKYTLVAMKAKGILG